MSDFAADVDKMFDTAMGQIDQIARVYLQKVGDYLVIKTPGPGNQVDGTEYIAKGVLRMGYNWYSEAPPAIATVSDNEGDDTYDADAVIGKLTGQLAGLQMRGDLWLVTDVIYASIVHDGGGRHREKREFTTDTMVVVPALLNEAVAEVMK